MRSYRTMRVVRATPRPTADSRRPHESSPGRCYRPPSSPPEVHVEVEMHPDSSDLCRRPRGLVGRRSCGGSRRGGFTNILTASASSSTSATSRRSRLVQGEPARVRVPRRRHRRRHPGQLHAPGRVPLRQHDDPRHRGARRRTSTACASCCTSASSCIYPRHADAADHRGAAAHRTARADQRGVRDRQDRRHQALPGVPPAVRLRLHLGDADEPLRAERQLRPRRRATCCRR